jgi:hypothetical protein
MCCSPLLTVRETTASRTAQAKGTRAYKQYTGNNDRTRSYSRPSLPGGRSRISPQTSWQNTGTGGNKRRQLPHFLPGCARGIASLLRCSSRPCCGQQSIPLPAQTSFWRWPVMLTAIGWQRRWQHMNIPADRPSVCGEGHLHAVISRLRPEVVYLGARSGLFSGPATRSVLHNAEQHSRRRSNKAGSAGDAVCAQWKQRRWRSRPVTWRRVPRHSRYFYAFCRPSSWSATLDPW